MSTLLNIAALSRRSGVAPDTLRKWEQRYGVLRPQRTPGGQRRYTEQDVYCVEWLRDRLHEGWRIGEAWHRGEVSVAQEHAVSTQVRARLDQLIADARGGVRDTAILACAPGEQHELGLLMLAVLLRADGWKVSYLGQCTPVAETLAYADTLGARLVCVSAARRETLDGLRTGLVTAGRRQRPIALGGRLSHGGTQRSSVRSTPASTSGRRSPG